MAIAYLVNQHPKFSQTFIRREILALESLGTPIRRFSVRSGESLIVDAADREEFNKTSVILGVGAVGLTRAILSSIARRPKKFGAALKLSIQTGLKSDRGLLLNLIYLAEAAVLYQWLKRDNIEHLHVHFGTNSTTVAMLCHALGGPNYSFTVHGPEEFDRLVGLSLTEKIHRAAFVVAISSFGRSQLYRWCDHHHWPKIKVVHCGVDRDFLERTITPIPKAANLTCIGRLCEQKGQLILVQAAKQLVEEGFDFRLTLVGDGEMRSVLETLIAQWRLQHHVVITGIATTEQVQEFLQEARALVLPSFGEGLPVAIMEALAMGRPVVSTYIAGIPELIKPGKNGWLVPAGDVEALTQALKEVITAPIEQLEQMGKLGAEAVAQNHDVQKEAQYLSELFQQQVQPSSERPRLTTTVPLTSIAS
jgi:colanic acid/amylovoran biosynthesis glycosyltransferase